MTIQAPIDPIHAAGSLVELFGRPAWQARLTELKLGCQPTYAGRALAQRHAIELTLDRLRRHGRNTPLTVSETCILKLAADLAVLARIVGRPRLETALAQAITGCGTLVPLFHLLRTACVQRGRGFEVSFAGLEEQASFDLLLWRDGMEAEVVCDVMSAEAGRDVHRGAWFALMDRVDPDLQGWLATHPGRYLLKMTLPKGLKADEPSGNCTRLPELHRRITSLLSGCRRSDHDEAAVLRLDPLVLAAVQVERGLMPRLRREFGPEAHLAVTSSGDAVFVMAARAGREDEVAVAVHRRMAEIAPARLSGKRPGILAMFLEDTDRLEWRILRDQLRLEGEARHFLTRPEAASVVAVTCASRLELVCGEDADAAEGGELRFRNPSHPHARALALAPAVLSSC